LHFLFSPIRGETNMAKVLRAGNNGLRAWKNVCRLSAFSMEKQMRREHSEGRLISGITVTSGDHEGLHRTKCGGNSKHNHILRGSACW
jgi:hypothetical protein